MINADLWHVSTLEEFNKEIRRQQEAEHGKDYCQIHDAINKYIGSCDSYMELGTHQGGTASAALLNKPSKVILVDIDLSKYRKFLEPIATKFSADNNIYFTTIESDSTSLRTINQVDMLLIDSLHKPQHMEKELAVHGINTRKYIIAHDTSIVNGRQNDCLFTCLSNYASANGWKVIERGTTNVGYTVLGR